MHLKHLLVPALLLTRLTSQSKSFITIQIDSLNSETDEISNELFNLALIQEIPIIQVTQKILVKPMVKLIFMYLMDNCLGEKNTKMCQCAKHHLNDLYITGDDQCHSIGDDIVVSEKHQGCNTSLSSNTIQIRLKPNSADMAVTRPNYIINMILEKIGCIIQPEHGRYGILPSSLVYSGSNRLLMNSTSCVSHNLEMKRYTDCILTTGNLASTSKYEEIILFIVILAVSIVVGICMFIAGFYTSRSKRAKYHVSIQQSPPPIPPELEFIENELYEPNH